MRGQDGVDDGLALYVVLHRLAGLVRGERAERAEREEPERRQPPHGPPERGVEHGHARAEQQQHERKVDHERVQVRDVVLLDEVEAHRVGWGLGIGCWGLVQTQVAPPNP